VVGVAVVVCLGVAHGRHRREVRVGVDRGDVLPEVLGEAAKVRADRVDELAAHRGPPDHLRCVALAEEDLRHHTHHRHLRHHRRHQDQPPPPIQ
jgi:hypothetical protein